MLGGPKNVENVFFVFPARKKHGLLPDETAESAVSALKSRSNVFFELVRDFPPGRPGGRFEG